MAAKTESITIPVKDIIEWDIPNWSQLIPHWQPLLDQLPRSAKILAVGERNGGLSLWLASMGFEVLCTDILEPTPRAIVLHRLYNVADKIEYRQFDVVNDHWNEEQFDIIIAKSVIGGLKGKRSSSSSRGIEAQQKAIDNINRLLKPGGYFLSAENLRGGIINRFIRKKTKGNKGWLHLDYKSIPGMFAAFSLVQTKTFGILPTFFRSGQLNAALFFINRYALFFLPESGRYIAFITARK